MPPLSKLAITFIVLFGIGALVAVTFIILYIIKTEDDAVASTTGDAETGIVMSRIVFPAPFPGDTVDIPVTIDPLVRLTGSIVGGTADIVVTLSTENRDVSFAQGAPNFNEFQAPISDGIFTACGVVAVGAGTWRIFVTKSLNADDTIVQTLMYEGITDTLGEVIFASPIVVNSASASVLSNVSTVAKSLRIIDGSSFCATLSTTDTNDEIKYFTETSPGTWANVKVGTVDIFKNFVVYKKGNDILVVVANAPGIKVGSYSSANNGQTWGTLNVISSTASEDVAIFEQENGDLTVLIAPLNGVGPFESRTLTGFPANTVWVAGAELSKPNGPFETLRLGDSLVIASASAAVGMPGSTTVHIYIVNPLDISQIQQETSVLIPLGDIVDDNVVYVTGLAEVDGILIVSWGVGALAFPAKQGSTGYFLLTLSDITATSPFIRILDELQATGTNIVGFLWDALAADSEGNIGLAFFSLLVSSADTSNRSITRAEFVNLYNVVNYAWAAN